MPKSIDFHPLRWMRNRPFAKAVMAIASGAPSNVAITQSALNRVLNLIMRHYNDAIMRVPFGMRPDGADIRSFFTGELVLAVVAALMLTKSRNIFTLSNGLSHALEQTDIDGVRVDDIKLPYNSFYLAFGSNFEGFLPGSDNRIDGAYVASLDENSMKLLISTRRLDVDVTSSRRWPFSRDPAFMVSLDNMKPEDTFKELLDAAVSSGQINIDMSVGYLPDVDTIDVPDDMANGIEKASDVSRRYDVIEGRRNAEAFPAVKRALSLVIGTLAYFGAEPDEINEKAVWTEDVPSGILRSFRLAKSEIARDNAERRLLDNGFSRIRILGKSFERLKHEGEPTGREFTHSSWRRGFYGWRAVGPNRSQRKWTWIRPAPIRPDLEGPDRGRIYDVE